MAGPEVALQLAKKIIPTSCWRGDYQVVTQGHLTGWEYRINYSSTTQIKGTGPADYGESCLQIIGPIGNDRSYPPADRMLMEYLLIRHDERKYLTTACVHGGDMPSTIRTFLYHHPQMVGPGAILRTGATNPVIAPLLCIGVGGMSYLIGSLVAHYLLR